VATTTNYLYSASSVLGQETAMTKLIPHESPGFLVGRISHALKLRVQEFLDEAGIPASSEEISILTVLAHLDDPERMTALAELLGRDVTTMSRQVNGLEKADFAKRSPCRDDGRAVVVSITSAGKKLVQRTIPMTFALRERAMKNISQADVKVLTQALMQMLDNLRDDD
jgi:DNA-binding MarR family transcriptional regulator